MTHSSLLALAALSLVLAACESPPKVTPSSHNPQLELKLANGTYNCEHKVRIQVEREIRDRVNYRITIGWNGGRYRLERDPSYSGLPRFEDSANGLVWIDMPWKSLLLDGKTNKPLVNECRPA